MADFYAKSNPERALFWRSNHPEAAVRMAERMLDKKDWTSAVTYAQIALAANPLDGRALRVLAQVADAQGDSKRALNLYQRASKLAPRDQASHVWLFQHAIKHRDAKSAVHHLDSLLRLNPKLLAVLQSHANALAAHPSAQAHMIDALAKSPPWRADFLREFAKSNNKIDAIAPVFMSLAKQSKIEPDELRHWLTRLLSSRRYTQAYLSWVTQLPEGQHKYLGNIFDGGFEIAEGEQNGNFAWNYTPIDGALAFNAATRGTIGQNSFTIQFDGKRTAFANLTQMLVLPVGSWTFRFRAKAEHIDNSRGLIWRIQCDHNAEIIAESKPLQGRFDWQSIDFNFEVPEKCEGQRLTLLIPARIAAETKINGAIWLDEIAIQPQVKLP